MNKKDIAEIKRRLKIDKTTITRLAGCYVSEQKEKITSFTKHFLNLEEDEAHKYLDLANKALSGAPGNNLLELAFASAGAISPLKHTGETASSDIAGEAASSENDEGTTLSENAGEIIEMNEPASGMQDLLLALRSSHLEDDALLEEFYDRIIDTYDTVDHYLILLFYDTYDIPIKTTDNLLLGDSDEVYEYLIVCICPVKLSKGGLGYHPAENNIAPLTRDWTVSPTECGFTFPCFSERSSDIHHLLAYTKNPKEPPVNFWEMGLQVESRFTATQKRLGFLGLVAKAVGEESEETPGVLLDVQQNMHDYASQKEEAEGQERPVLLSETDIAEILEDSGLNETRSTKVASEYAQIVPAEELEARDLFEAKALKNNELRQEKKILQEKVASLSDELLRLGLVNEDGEIIDIVVRTRPERKDNIETTFIDGRKCIVIPLEEDDTATVNGEEFL